MNDVKGLQEQVEKAIAQLELNGHPQSLYEPISYTMQLGGKRLRPVLVLLSAQLAGGPLSAGLGPAVGIELFHNFTLLHDDIMDAAPLRRGKPTVFKKYNTDTAILAGDVMMVMAHQRVMDVEDNVVKPILDIFNRTAIQVCEGQQLDLNFETSASVTIDDYLEMIRLKTAVLLGASMAIGGYVGQSNHELAMELKEVGENLGMAFQMQDDILDSFGDPEKFGKQSGGDIIQNKKTYLLLKAREKASEEVRAELEQWIGKKEFDADKKVKAIKVIFEETGAYNDARELRDAFYAKAIGSLQQLEVKEEPKATFLRLAESLLNREH